MKKLILFFTTIFLVGACSQSEQNSEPASQTMVEYVWMTAGPDFNAENLAFTINTWNQMIDDMGCSLNANILTPEVENEGYDFIWVHIWESEEARDNCWSDWEDNHKTDWDNAIAGIMNYDLDNVYMFKPTVEKSPRMENTSGSFVNSFYFCTVNEGYSMADLDAYKESLNQMDVFSDYWWYLTLEPMFEADPKPDFVWLDIWGSAEDRDSDREIWSKTSLPADVEAKFSCLPNSNGAGFVGTAIRRS